jgi:hypothetical protein
VSDSSEEVKAKLVAVMQSMGNPPHILAVLTDEKEIAPGVFNGTVTGQVPEDLMLSHFGLMMGAILATIANNDHEKARDLVGIVAASTHQAIEEYLRNKRRLPPEMLN